MKARLLGSGMAAFVLIFTSASPAVAAARGDNERGVIVSERYSTANGGNPQLVAVRPVDGHVRVLTSGHRDVTADVAPDGRRIVFARCLRGLKCADIGKVNIWIMRADGSHQHALTFCDGSRCLGAFDPAFSPDGRFIAFEEDRLDARRVNVNGIFIMRIDGTNLRRLTSTGPDAPFPDGNPQFSPDGKQLVFTREVPGGFQLMVVRVDGTGLRRLLPGVDGSGPSWSPDGQHISFTLARHGDTTSFDIATVRPNGTHLRLLTMETATLRAALLPDYSPGGRRIVFSEADAAGCRLVTISDSGGSGRTLPTGRGCFLNPSWGPEADAAKAVNLRGSPRECRRSARGRHREKHGFEVCLPRERASLIPG